MATDTPAPSTLPVTVCAVTEGRASAPTILRKIPVRWILDPATGYVKSNGEHAGRVIESIPGKLYYFQSPEDAARGDCRGLYSVAEDAAEWGAVCHVLAR